MDESKSTRLKITLGYFTCGGKADWGHVGSRETARRFTWPARKGSVVACIRSATERWKEFNKLTFTLEAESNRTQKTQSEWGSLLTL